MEKCGSRSRVEPTQMKMYEKFASKTKKRCEARPRMDDFPEKTIKKNVEDRPKNNDFFEKSKTANKKKNRRRTEEQQRTRFGGSSFCHYKIAVMLQKCCKNQYETRAATVKGAQQ